MRIIEPLSLLLLAQEPGHGYRLVAELEHRFGIRDLPPQTVYRSLQAMEDQAWVTSTWDMSSAQGPPRKVFRITDEGCRALARWVEEIEDLRGVLDSFLRTYGSVATPIPNTEVK